MIKILALIFMTIDHVGFFTQSMIPEELYLFTRLVGRWAMPLFMFSLAMGVKHTKNIERYFLRLLGVGLIAQIPYSMYIDDSSLNIVLLMSVVVFLVALYRRQIEIKQPILNAFVAILWFVLVGLLVGLPYTSIGSFFEYQSLAPIVYAFFLMEQYEYVDKWTYGILALGIALLTPYLLGVGFFYPIFTIFYLVSYIGAFLLRNVRAIILPKWFFYIYYPLHLVVINYAVIYFLKS